MNYPASSNGVSIYTVFLFAASRRELNPLVGLKWTTRWKALTGLLIKSPMGKKATNLISYSVSGYCFLTGGSWHHLQSLELRVALPSVTTFSPFIVRTADLRSSRTSCLTSAINPIINRVINRISGGIF